jgi:hypothetical protein
MLGRLRSTCCGSLAFLRSAARAHAGRLSTVFLIGSRLFCLRVEPSLDLVKVAKMYQAVLIP